MSTILKTIRDRINIEYHQFFRDNPGEIPDYLILDRESYSLLKESLDIPAYEDIADFQGFIIHIKPLEKDYIRFI